MWLDGTEVFSKTDLLYRTVDTLKDRGDLLDVVGGADPSWAPARDQYADFAGFELSKTRIGCQR